MYPIASAKSATANNRASFCFTVVINAPAGAPDYSIEGCPVGSTCPYNTVKLYLDDKHNNWFKTTCTRLVKPTNNDIINAITNTQYSKCVFKCDNNVVDHQIVNMLFAVAVDIFILLVQRASCTLRLRSMFQLNIIILKLVRKLLFLLLATMA